MTSSQGTVEIGDRAPGFTLRHTFETSVSLEATLRRGPVVLVFYVFDFGGL
jgi:peroxiredoxin